MGFLTSGDTPIPDGARLSLRCSVAVCCCGLCGVFDVIGCRGIRGRDVSSAMCVEANPWFCSQCFDDKSIVIFIFISIVFVFIANDREISIILITIYQDQ
mgnify:CR=1 FL=1